MGHFTRLAAESGASWTRTGGGDPRCQCSENLGCPATRVAEADLTPAGGVRALIFVRRETPRVSSSAHALRCFSCFIPVASVQEVSGGLAVPPTNEWTPLTRKNIELMAANLFRQVPQYTQAM